MPPDFYDNQCYIYYYLERLFGNNTKHLPLINYMSTSTVTRLNFNEIPLFLVTTSVHNSITLLNKAEPWRTVQQHMRGQLWILPTLPNIKSYKMKWSYNMYLCSSTVRFCTSNPIQTCVCTLQDISLILWWIWSLIYIPRQLFEAYTERTDNFEKCHVYSTPCKTVHYNLT